MLWTLLVKTRDCKGFFEDPETRGSPADFYLRNPGVYNLGIFAFFGDFFQPRGSSGLCFSLISLKSGYRCSRFTPKGSFKYSACVETFKKMYSFKLMLKVIIHYNVVYVLKILKEIYLKSHIKCNH